MREKQRKTNPQGKVLRVEMKINKFSSRENFRRKNSTCKVSTPNEKFHKNIISIFSNKKPH
jgi:hypothetical protein